MVRGLVASVCVLGALVLAAAAAPDVARAADPHRVQVSRTAFGVPHIRANDFRSLGYGYAQAAAEDNVCTIADTYVTVGAQRSRFFGPDARFRNRGNGSTASNLEADLFFQRIIDTGRVEKLVAQRAPLGPKDEIREVVDGYVAGWNAWLRETGGPAGITDPACRGADWVRPITAIDVWRRFHQLALLASSAIAVDGIAGAQPPTPATAPSAGPTGRSTPTGTGAVRALPPGEVDRRLGVIGSNAYALGRDATRDGNGLLYGNPHFPWKGSERFYQAHLTIKGKLDVTGGSLLGVPVALIGSTRGMSWSHTVSTARRFVPYELRLVPGSPTSYVEDGRVRQMQADRVTVQVRTPDGRLEPRTRTLYSSHHGPITNGILGLPIFPWTNERAYALHDGNVENFGRLLNHFFDMNRAQTVDEVDAIQKRYQGIPWVNTIATDTGGSAYYADIGTVPNVDVEQYGRCQVALGRALDQAQRVPVLDGSRTDCLPQSDPDAVVPGILGPSRMPSLRRDDHVSNMNDSYWLTNPAERLEGFSRIIGDERTQRTLRTRMGLKMIEDRLAGRDGLPGNRFDVDGLERIGLGNRVMSAELWRDELVAGCSSAACDVLRRWDLRNDLDSGGAILWQRFVRRLLGAAPVALPGAAGPFRVPFDPADPVNTPRGLNRDSATVQNALRQAVADLEGAGLPLDVSPRRGQTITRRGETIPIHGGPDESGLFNIITSVWDPAKGYTDVDHGSSYMQVVDMKARCPDLRTFVTYGQSESTASERSVDQTRRYRDKAWVRVPFCSSDLEREMRRDPATTRVHTADLGPSVVTLAEARGTARPRILVRRPAGTPATVRVRLRRGGRVTRTIRRRGPGVLIAPRVPRGINAAVVEVGGRTVKIVFRQR